MKKVLCTVACIISLQCVFAQTVTPTADTSVMGLQQPPVPAARKDWKKIDLGNRSNDHLVMQFGIDGWSGTPDSINPQGFSRHFNAYMMLDKPFKTNPKLSVAFGVGIGSSNVFFKNTSINLKSNSTALPFTKVDSTDHFKKYKLATVYAEAPIELRFNSDPENNNKAWKGAIGVKVGTLLSAHTKGKTLENKSGQTINAYVLKENSKRFFNGTKVAGTARIGYGIFSIHGDYNITALLKDAAGPVIRPYAVGLTISGL